MFGGLCDVTVIMYIIIMTTIEKLGERLDTVGRNKLSLASESGLVRDYR